MKEYIYIYFLMLLNIITRNYIRNLAFKKKNYSAKLFSWRQFIFSIFFKLYINLYKLIIIIIIEYKIKEKNNNNNLWI